MRRHQQQREQSHRQRRQSYAAQHTRRIAVAQAARDRRHDGHQHRPWRHQEAGLDRRAAQGGFKIKRQRHEGQALRGEGADRRQRGQGKQRAAEQIDRQHRRRVAALAPQQQREEDGGAGHLRQQGAQRDLVRAFAGGQDQQAERADVVERGQAVDGVAGARRVRQRATSQPDGDHAQRHVDRK